ncbi:unnamed protein product, partial [Cyprideis torosa]
PVVACGNRQAVHRGRFAPSPTGPLHQGSLVAAVGSYLCAHKQGGSWLVRIEDLDPPREDPLAADTILRTLEKHALYWDEAVLRQSDRQFVYQETVDTLLQGGLAYYCQCSRKQLQSTAIQGPMGPIYPGTCRNKNLSTGAVRLRTIHESIAFNDARIGHYTQRLATELGDFVIQRRDHWFAYQLAVVVDDAAQGITDIVRGEDLLDNTPRQIYLQHLLGLPTPQYLHLPLNNRGFPPPSCWPGASKKQTGRAPA